MTQPPVVRATKVYPSSPVGDERVGGDSAECVCAPYLDQLFENIPDGVVLVDTDDRILRVNPEFSRMFGYAQEDITGRSLAELVVPEFLHQEAMSLARRVLHGDRVVFETVRCRADGSLMDVSMVAIAVQINGEAVARYVMYRDTTEQKRHDAERAELLARERRDHSVVSDPDRHRAILAGTASLLAEDEDVEVTLGRLARFLVPQLADSCIVYLRDRLGRVRRVEVAFADPGQEDLLREQLRSYPPELQRLIPPVARALSTGEAQLLPEVSIGALKAIPGDTEHVSVALLVGLNSLLVVPLTVGGETVGAISLGTADSGRRFHAEDLALTEEIARRTAAVIARRLG